MYYVKVAVNTPVEATFDYHVPPELEGKLQPGHLVQVNFRTAMEHAIVLSLHGETDIETTKPVLERLDPRPVVSEDQIALAWWMSRAYHAPIGLCLWIWLPPGLTGHRDILVTLRENYAPELVIDQLEEQIVALLKRRGTLRGHQLNLSLTGKNWRAAVDGLAKVGVLDTESTLTPPRVKPRIIQTAALAIHPDDIPQAVLPLEHTSLMANLLEIVADQPGIEAKAALKASGANKSHLDKLIAEGSLSPADDDTLTTLLAPGEIALRLNELRRLDKPLRILSILAREGDPVDVSWVYAQADASLNDLKRLEEAELILLGEQQKWRDSLAQKEFVAAAPPTLTSEQQVAWERLEQVILDAHQTPQNLTPPQATEGRRPPRIRGGEQGSTPPPTPPRLQGGENTHDPNDEKSRRWSVPKEIYQATKQLAREQKQEPTPAEDRLWEALRNKQLSGFKFRRQQPIERFIVDFYSSETQLVIEVDGEIHQYTQADDAVRQQYLESLGLAVIRFTNDDVLHNLQDVLLKIATTTRERLDKTARFSPLPEVGEGSGVGSPSAFLLHGVTGSGKTELYLRAIELTLALGRSAIFLVPEIALTPQTVRRVAARFPGRTAVVHSGLGEGERFDTWRRARDGLVRVVVGARSALFTPLLDVGLIVLDEEHDASYKQTPPILPPYYHARDLAEAMMRQNNGIVIVGSATPDVATMYRVERGEIEKLELPRRVMGHRVRIQEQAERAGVAPRYRAGDTADTVMIDLPPVQVIDMRSELKNGNVSIFSRALQQAVADALDRREQSILFLNRRGQSTYVFCRDCGYIAKCPRCDTPLTYHRAGSALRCHRCGYMQPPPTICPQCESKRIKFFGAGTQQVEQALIEMFPRARVVRWDSDTADLPEAHEAILQRFIDRKADVMVGTQMVAKGLDLPLVTLVGVVSADVGLALPDFRAGERTFQLLTQVAGRAGRGLLGGRVILQTYQPEHYAITAASKHDYAQFYEREIAYRREMGYPPFRRFVRILFRYPNETKAQQEAERAAQILRHRIETLNLIGTELIGPAPCFFTRENNIFRWQLLLRGPDPTPALAGLDVPRGWYVDVDPVEVL